MPEQTMTGDYLDRLNQKHNEHLDAIATVERAALDANDGAGRELTDAELAEVDVHRSAIDALTPQIERWESVRRTRVDSATHAASTPPAFPVQRSNVQVIEGVTRGTSASPGPAPDGEPVFRSAGEAALAFINAQRGQQDAGEQVKRALAVQTTAETPGLLPVPTLGELRGMIDQPRSIISTARRLPLPPAGMQFRRPRVAQHTLVTRQGAEKTEVGSRAMRVEFDNVDLFTYAGAVNISIQDVERTSPGALDLLYQDFANSYGVATEADMAAELVAAGTANRTTLAANATLATMWSTIFTAAGAMVGATRSRVLPNIIYASIDQWARIGGATTPTNPQNAIADAVPTELRAALGNIQVVVSPDLPTGTIILANRNVIEYVEDERAPIRLQVPEPRILGYEAGVYGYFLPYISDPAGVALLGPAS